MTEIKGLGQVEGRSPSSKEINNRIVTPQDVITIGEVITATRKLHETDRIDTPWRKSTAETEAQVQAARPMVMTKVVTPDRTRMGWLKP